MTDLRAALPLSEIVRFALPAGADYVVGAATDANSIRWAVVVGVPLRRDELMEAGDLVIVAERSDRPDWERALRQFVDLGVAALIVKEPPPAVALDIASAADLPIVSVPKDGDLRAIHRAVLSLILKEEGQIAQRSASIQRQLNRLAADEDASLPALAEVIASHTGHGVVVQDKRLNVVAVQRPDDMPSSDWEKVVSALGKADSLPNGWSDRKAAARNARGKVERQALTAGVGRVVTPIVVGDRARGYLSVIGPLDRLDTLDSLAAEQGAEVYALAMSKAKAVHETTKKMRGDFVDAVLAGSIAASELERWAGRLGHNIYAPHAVVIFAWPDGDEMPSMRRMETIVNGEIGLGRHSALVRNTGDEIECFVMLKQNDSIQEALQLAKNVCAQSAVEYPESLALGGIGRVARGLEDWETSHRQASQALLTARRIDAEEPLFFGDLSVYRLLFEMQDHPELAQFCSEMLGELLQYDVQHNSTLVETLSGYFAQGGNLTRTAEALYIHRNTLQYRMERIGDITGLDLDNPETRLAMQLALKAYRLLPNDLGAISQ